MLKNLNYTTSKDGSAIKVRNYFFNRKIFKGFIYEPINAMLISCITINILLPWIDPREMNNVLMNVILGIVSVILIINLYINYIHFDIIVPGSIDLEEEYESFIKYLISERNEENLKMDEVNKMFVEWALDLYSEKVWENEKFSKMAIIYRL